MDLDDERRALIRSVRQRLDSLHRAGIDRITMPVPPTLGPSSRVVSASPRPRPAIAPAQAPEIGDGSPRPRQDPIVVGPSLVMPERPTPTIRMPSEATPPAVPGRADRPTSPPPVAASLFGEPELAPIVPEAERASALLTLAAEVSRCTRCPELAATRTQTVFGEGRATARLMFVGEAPGADEDQTGRPFVGRAGSLLTDMITKGMGLARTDVYIANILKSRPPENRTPTSEEIGHCLPYLEQQIATIRPQFLCLLGKTAASALLETALPLGRLRGKWHRYRTIPTIVTYHPSALLRNPAWKKEAWEDLQILMQAMGVKPPERRKPG